MKILIISDTHGKHDNFYRVLEQEDNIDMLIHCGDFEGGEFEITSAVDCPCHMVAGNNDFFTDVVREKEFKIGPYNVFLTHGHSYYVYMNKDFIRREGKGRSMDIVMFGHTHIPVVDKTGGITLLNPGSLSYPRQHGRCPSYIIMTMEDGKEPEYEIKYI